MNRSWLFLLPLGVCLIGARLPAQEISTDRTVGQLEVVAKLNSGPMPTGVTVSRQGRIFFNFPHWGDKVDATVVEWKDGHAVPFPAGLPQSGNVDPAKKLMSVQSVVVDAKDHLWILDTGRVEGAPAPLGGAKLVEVNLFSNSVERTIVFPREVAPADSYMNDVRLDDVRDRAYITDSSETTHGLIVVDLKSGKSWKRLTHDHSTEADSTFQPFLEGQALLTQGADGKPAKPRDAADGIALSGDHTYLYYCPIFSRHLYRVPAELLANPEVDDAKLAKAVEDMGDKGMSDGMEADAEGHVYFGDLENDSIRRWSPAGGFELIAHDPRILWPDTLSLANNGYLYFTANQLHRMPKFHHGHDERVKPYVLFRIRVNGHPVS
ncbi:L-dopachrome tautomerase-related protein [Silvibacterium sp.]|uniref:L-dopachrome tautomerase-related protein n=1 Tax=Silvibacterium sp. TaxID=1964179 RepID=UPI0039E527AB